MPDDSFSYTGRDNLEVMADAKNYNGFLIAEVRAAVPDRPEPRILDFGAGAGTYASLLRDAGTTAECLEPDETLQGVIRDAGFTVVPDAETVPDKTYDLVYSLNVFEHIEDDQAAAYTVYAKLKPGGTLLVYVPAFMSLFSSMDRKVGHFRRYRKAPLVELLRRAGFDVRTARYCDPLGFFAALVFRFVGNDDGDLNPHMIRLFDRVVFPISRLLERITGPFFGKNVLVVARRPD